MNGDTYADLVVILSSCGGALSLGEGSIFGGGTGPKVTDPKLEVSCLYCPSYSYSPNRPNNNNLKYSDIKAWKFKKYHSLPPSPQLPVLAPECRLNARHLLTNVPHVSMAARTFALCPSGGHSLRANHS